MAGIPTLLRTIRHLKPVQVYRRVYRPKPRLRHEPTPDLRPRTGPWRDCIQHCDPCTTPGRFRFLNQDRHFNGWNPPDVPKLWIYNLHYFNHPDMEWAERWVRENPPGQGNGWEPYPLSLRIVNWIKARLAGRELSSELQSSLADQVRFLSQSLEYHLLANHLFANGKALVFAGAFFSGGEGRSWLERGLRILRREIREQILPDGGHFERSPMYHALILEDVLDLVNLCGTYTGLIPARDENTWRGTAASMLIWLSNMCHPDRRISFFNDAAFQVAPEPVGVSDYAARLLVAPEAQALSSSGYVRLENARATVLVDAAPLGPDYQPGHAHADTLSFELSVEGRRLLVNSGTSTYEKNELRSWQRGTSAHNTLVVDGQDQSEVWSGFRVGHRARPRDLRTNGRSFVECAHDGYLRLPDPVLHRRRIDLHDDRLVVTDSIDARTEHEVEIYFHFHPQAQPLISLDPALHRRTEDTFWYPEFNLAVPNQTIVGRWRGSGPRQFRSVIPFSNA